MGRAVAAAQQSRTNLLRGEFAAFNYQIVARRLPEIASLTYGIVNGTCNYPTRMKLSGGLCHRLAKPSKLGTPRPGLADIDGHDALHKPGSWPHGARFWGTPHNLEGIRNITALDIKFAAQLGYTIKLLGIIKKVGRKQPKPSPLMSSRIPGIGLPNACA
jgi:homoserine dehydrogenase